MSGTLAAMVLAAGRGERMRPLTRRRAKPSLPVLGAGLAERVIDQLEEVGVTDLAVNACHGSQSLEIGLAGRSVKIFREPRVMGTGGALDAPREMLARGPFFLLHNADTLTRIPLDALVEAVEADRRHLGALLVSSRPISGYRPIAVADGQVQALSATATDPRAATYLGLALFRREVLDAVPRGRPSELFPDVVLPRLAEGWRLAAVATDAPWLEFTSAASYLAKVCALLEGRTVLPHGRARGRLEKGVFLASEARVAAGADLRTAALEKAAVIERGVRLERCLLLEGAHCEPECRLEDVVLDAGVRLPAGSRFSGGVLTTENGELRLLPSTPVEAR